MDEEDDEPLQTKLSSDPGSGVVARKAMPNEPPGGPNFPIRQDANSNTVRRTPESPYSMSEGRIVDEDEESVQTKAEAGSATATGPAISAKVETAVRRPGTALPDSTRTFMESGFGYDFSRVQIHADETAAEAAESVNARAFTRGNNIVFGRAGHA